MKIQDDIKVHFLFQDKVILIRHIFDSLNYPVINESEPFLSLL